MDNIGKIFEVASTELGIGEVSQLGREGEIEQGRESEMDNIGKIFEVASTELGIGEVAQIGREGEIERGRESEMDNIGKICEVASIGLGEGEIREAGLAKIDIGKVREASSAYYKDLTVDEQEAAEEFFQAMDTNNSKTIDINEFRNFLSHAKIQTDERLFKELDKDKSGFLDFQELVTFFYVLSRDEYKHLLNPRASTDITGRDEYKHPLNYRASTDITGRKEESNHPKIGSQQVPEADGQVQKWDMDLFRRLYGKLKRAYKFVEGQTECSIV